MKLRSFTTLCFPTRGALALALFVCVIAPTTLVALQINENPEFSPIDEVAHWDYVTRVANQGFPRIGDTLQQSTLRENACRKTDLSGLVIPKCNSKYFNPEKFPGGAQQYEAQHPPTYYALTVPLRWIATDIFGFSDVSGTRFTGILWLVAGLLLLWAAGRVLDLPPPTIGVGILLLTTAPVVIYHTAVISNDVPSIFIGSLIAFVAALCYQRPGRWTIALAAVGFFAASVKATSMIPIAAISAAFAVKAWAESGKEAGGSYARTSAAIKKWLYDGGALLIGGVAASLIWVVVSRQLATINPGEIAAFGVLRLNPVGPELILKETLSLLGPVTDSFVSPATLSQDLQVYFYGLLKIMLIAGAFSGFFVAARKWNHWLGLTTLGSLIIVGTLLGVSVSFTYKIDPGISGRYGLAAAPLLVLALVAGIRGVWIIRGLWLFALASLTTTLCVMIFSYRSVILFLNG